MICSELPANLLSWEKTVELLYWSELAGAREMENLSKAPKRNSGWSISSEDPSMVKWDVVVRSSEKNVPTAKIYSWGVQLHMVLGSIFFRICMMTQQTLSLWNHSWEVLSWGGTSHLWSSWKCSFLGTAAQEADSVGLGVRGPGSVL